MLGTARAGIPESPLILTCTPPQGGFFIAAKWQTAANFSLSSRWYSVLTGRVTRTGLLASSG